jgi:hypothetical protein
MPLPLDAKKQKTSVAPAKHQEEAKRLTRQKAEPIKAATTASKPLKSEIEVRKVLDLVLPIIEQSKRSVQVAKLASRHAKVAVAPVAKRNVWGLGLGDDEPIKTSHKPTASVIKPIVAEPVPFARKRDAKAAHKAAPGLKAVSKFVGKLSKDKSSSTKKPLTAPVEEPRP